MRYFLIFLLLISPTFSFGHGGGLDSDGGHTNRKTGAYHYHKKVAQYDRNEYGRWRDVDRDCQNTRHEVLIGSSAESVQFKTEKQCLVVSGLWIGLYTGNIFSNARQLDIDHVVPLKEAHISGASGWTKEMKRQFANDEENLLAVSRSANRSKGAKDPAQWMPKNEAFHCEYIKKWVAVKEKVMLYMDRNEQQKINRVLAGC
jgi:hypothetical protein